MDATRIRMSAMRAFAVPGLVAGIPRAALSGADIGQSGDAAELEETWNRA
jgi:hypothetical protein